MQALDELKEAIKERSYKESHDDPFLLASGKTSPYYLDLKETLFIPRYLNIACVLMLEKILQHMKTPPAALAGLTMGADPLIYGISLVGEKRGFNILPLIVRKQEKDHGSKKKVEGKIHQLDQNEEIILIDDVVTTGGSALKAHQAVCEAGFRPKFAFSLVDREEGSRERFKNGEIAHFSLFQMSDFKEKNKLTI